MHWTTQHLLHPFIIQFIVWVYFPRILGKLGERFACTVICECLFRCGVYSCTVLYLNAGSFTDLGSNPWFFHRDYFPPLSTSDSRVWACLACTFLNAYSFIRGLELCCISPRPLTSDLKLHLCDKNAMWILMLFSKKKKSKWKYFATYLIFCKKLEKMF